MLRHLKPVTCAIVSGLLVAGMPDFTAPAVAQSQPSWILPDLLAGAKAEGELIVYGSMNEEEALPFWQLFQDARGIKVNYVRSSDAHILARTARSRSGRASAAGTWWPPRRSIGCPTRCCCNSTRRKPKI